MRLNLSRSGIGASVGVKGLRFGVGPRGSRLTVGGRRVSLSSGRSRRSSGSETGMGCLVALAGLFGLVVLTVVIEFLMTPVPWIMAGVAGVVVGCVKLVRLFRHQRAQAKYLLALAALANDARNADAQLVALESVPREADICMLIAACALNRNDVPKAIIWVGRAGQQVHSAGRLSGGGWLRFAYLSDPLYFSADALPEEVVQLLLAHLLVCAGQYERALASFRADPASPRYALGVSILAAAQLAQGQHELALSGLHSALVSDGLSEELACTLRRLLARAYGERGHAAYAFEHYDWLAKRGHADAIEWVREFSLEQARQQRLARDAEEQTLLEDALARLERAKGPAGRRRAVERGLEKIVDPARREQLLVAGSTREVEAVLTKVRKLKTTKAKRRHLLAALEKLRTDDVSDALQVAEFQLIERELASLEAVR